MALKMTHIESLQTKIDFVASQKNELHRLLDSYVDKEVALAVTAVENKEHDLSIIQDIRSRLDSISEFLQTKRMEIKESGLNVSNTSPLESAPLSFQSGLLPSAETKSLDNISGQGAAADPSHSEAAEMATAGCSADLNQITTHETDQLVTPYRYSEERQAEVASVPSTRRSSLDFDMLDEVKDSGECSSSTTADVTQDFSNGRPGDVGFTAYYEVKSRAPILKDSLITDFSSVVCNEGDHYNRFTSQFTAPRDGIYLTSVTLFQSGPGFVNVCVVKQEESGKDGTSAVTVVCWSKTTTFQTRCCGFGLVTLKAGDILFVKVVDAQGDTMMVSPFSNFSCFLVG